MMEDLQPLDQNKDRYDKGNNKDPNPKREEKKPMPFGVLGILFLVGLTQFAALIGLTVLVVAIIVMFGSQ